MTPATRNLGVIFSSKLTFQDHVKKATQSYFLLLRTISKIKRILHDDKHDGMCGAVCVLLGYGLLVHVFFFFLLLYLNILFLPVKHFVHSVFKGAIQMTIVIITQIHPTVTSSAGQSRQEKSDLSNHCEVGDFRRTRLLLVALLEFKSVRIKFGSGSRYLCIGIVIESVVI